MEPKFVSLIEKSLGLDKSDISYKNSLSTKVGEFEFELAKKLVIEGLMTPEKGLTNTEKRFSVSESGKSAYQQHKNQEINARKS